MKVTGPILVQHVQSPLPLPPSPLDLSYCADSLTTTLFLITDAFSLSVKKIGSLFQRKIIPQLVLTHVETRLAKSEGLKLYRRGDPHMARRLSHQIPGLCNGLG